MIYRDELKSAVLQVSPSTFDDLALEVFRFQSKHNPVYGQYLQYLGINSLEVQNIEAIPFLPIQFFKQHRIVSEQAPTQFIFESSGTTGQKNSQHFVSDLPFYEQISRQIFEITYGKLSGFIVLALLPSYLERNTSSLVYMVQGFIEKTYSEHSGFYLHDTASLIEKAREIEEHLPEKKVLLIGVSFALLDLAEQHKNLFAGLKSRIIVMETGGMKGRRKELLREELHSTLKKGFGVDSIHSEYGMTELLSQAYSQKDGVFVLPNSMKILLRELNDPFTYTARQGGINVIDLANIDSCCFIETQDMGRWIEQPNMFEVIGRIDNSDVRGCSLMVV